MREIKFRAWDNRSEKMIVFKNADMWDTNWLDDSDIMQFTGLKDKNGVDIYEGDLLKFKATTVNGIFSIVFRNGSFCLSNSWSDYTSFDHYEFSSNNIQVIGNTHENPELIK